jgi:glycosyltransferase involved in cell wall biosynthesis
VKKNKVLVSVIVPVLNMDNYLDRFLADFERQTLFQNTEMILDLNCPSDYTLKIVKKYKARYKEKLVVNSQKNIDLIAVSMNRCISMASGRYIAIWNADDLRTPASLEKQLDQFSKDKSLTAVGGPFMIVHSFGESAGTLITVDEIDSKEFLRGMFLGPFMMFDSKALLKAGLFDEQLRSGADYDLAIRLARSGQLGFTPDLLGFYLDAGLGASTRPNSLQAIERSVIELRYGIFDKFKFEYLPHITGYDIPGLYFNGGRKLVQDYFPDYQEYYRSMVELYWQRPKMNFFSKALRKVIQAH